MEFALIFLESLKELVHPPRWVLVFSVPGFPVLVLGSALGLLMVPLEGPSSSLELGPSLLDLGAPLSTSFGTGYSSIGGGTPWIVGVSETCHGGP